MAPVEVMSNKAPISKSICLICDNFYEEIDGIHELVLLFILQQTGKHQSRLHQQTVALACCSTVLQCIPLNLKLWEDLGTK